MKPMWYLTCAVVAAMLACGSGLSRAAELTVLSAGAVRPALSTLVARYEASSGDTVKIEYGTAGSIAGDVAQGARGDLVILPVEGLDAAQAKGWVVAGSARELARVGIGVAVREGSPIPDIATPEALKRALLSAKSITYMDPSRGTSGKFVETDVLPALGIVDQVHAKARLQTEGYVGKAVANGEVELGIQQMSELLDVPGVKVVGPLPEPLQKTTTYAVGTLAAARAPDAAAKLVNFLLEPESQAVFADKGLQAPKRRPNM